MAVSINLEAAARYVHATAPTKLAGLFEAVETKCKALNLGPWRPITPKETTGDVESGHNVRGVLQFVDSVTAESGKTEKRNLQQLYATLQERCKAAGYKAPHQVVAEKTAAEKAAFDAAVKAEVDKREAAKAAPPAAPTK